jgi:copper homeostasis protein
MSKHVLEIACFNLESAIIAANSGADRIELCENYTEGGTTPSEKLILEVRNKIQLPIHVIIRPRGGDFVYTTDEIDAMKKTIFFCREQNIDGVVFGCLTTNNQINFSVCEELVKLANPMHKVFHRAIDQCDDLFSEIQKLINIGFSGVLSSGGKQSALDGKNKIAELNEYFKNKITIMPGGGIRSYNIADILNTTCCSEYHSAALINESFVCDSQEIKFLKSRLTEI